MIKKVKYLGNYKLKAYFKDGSVKIADFEDFILNSKNPSIRKFIDKDRFSKVVIECGDLSWENGEMDFPSDDVYDGVFTSKKEFSSA